MVANNKKQGMGAQPIAVIWPLPCPHVPRILSLNFEKPRSRSHSGPEAARTCSALPENHRHRHRHRHRLQL